MPLKEQRCSSQGHHYIHANAGWGMGCADGCCCVILLSTLNSGESGTLKSL